MFNTFKFVSVVSCLLVLVTIDTARAEVAFFDDFEGDDLHAYWGLREISGTITFPFNEQSASGAQSIRFESIPGGDKDIQLFHEYDQPTYGQWSVKFYDQEAGNSNSNYFNPLYLENASEVSSLWVQDWSGANYWESHVTGYSETSVSRTIGWHEFSITSLPNLMSLTIDGVEVYSAPSGFAFDRVSLRQSGPSWRPNGIVGYFDDFSFVVPEPASWTMGLFLFGVTFSATRKRASKNQVAFSPEPTQLMSALR